MSQDDKLMLNILFDPLWQVRSTSSRVLMRVHLLGFGYGVH